LILDTRRGRDLAFLLLSVGSMLLMNFFKSYNNLDVEGDGFIYLTLSKYCLLMGESKLRTPLIAFFLIPDIHLARVEMMLFHLGISVLIYELCMRYAENRRVPSRSFTLWFQLVVRAIHDVRSYGIACNLRFLAFIVFAS